MMSNLVDPNVSEKQNEIGDAETAEERFTFTTSVDFANTDDTSHLLEQLTTKGITFTKERKDRFGVTRTRKRTFFIIRNHAVLTYRPSKKYPKNNIFIGDILDIQLENKRQSKAPGAVVTSPGGDSSSASSSSQSKATLRLKYFPRSTSVYYTSSRRAVCFSLTGPLHLLQSLFHCLQKARKFSPNFQLYMANEMRWENFWGECFDLADKDKNGKISLKELKRVLHKKNCYLKDEIIEHHFRAVTKEKELSCDQFFQLYENLGPFPMQVQLFEKYAKHWREEFRKEYASQQQQQNQHESSVTALTASAFDLLVGDSNGIRNGGGTSDNSSGTGQKSTAANSSKGGNLATSLFWSHSYMLQSELEHFLQEDKKPDRPNAAAVIATYQKTSRKPGTLSFPGFLNFIMSDHCLITLKVEKKIHMDMNQPLNHYFVNSSHNTYLEGNQINSDSSTDAYLNALQKGARFVELDVYPGPNGDDPIIKHFKFPTKPVALRAVCEALRDNGFHHSHYPLILSIEDHCDSDTVAKTKMNKIFEEVFGNMLFYEDNEYYKTHELPSPEDLKHKIIIKNKKHRNELFINVCQGVSPKHLPDLLLEGHPNYVISLTKDKFYELCKNKPFETSPFAQRNSGGGLIDGNTFGRTVGEALVEWSKKSQLKVYPGNSQILSGHYDPRDVWLAGIQYATLNFQTVDKNLVFNIAMFNRNGGCGLVLKPDFLLPRSRHFFNPVTLTMTDKSSITGEETRFTKTTLKVHVLSAMHLPKPNDNTRGEIIDPYVKLSLFDKFDKENCKSFKTKCIDDNGFNPVWNEHFEFNVDCPDLAFLLFEVFDKDIDADDHVGQFCASFASLQRGYVTVPLFNKEYKPYPYSTLFAWIDIKPEKNHGRIFIESAL